MHSDYFRVLILACVVVILDGCVTPPSRPASTALCAIAENASIDPSFTHGFDVLSAMLNPRANSSNEISDWLLLGVKVTKADAHDVWFVRLSMLPSKLIDEQTNKPYTREFSVPFGIGQIKSGTKLTTEVNRVLVETFDHQGTPLRSSVRVVPQLPGNPSLLDLWRELAWPSGSLFDEKAAPDNAVAGMMMSLQCLGTARALRPIRDAVKDDVFKKPKILGLLLNGLRFSVEADFSQSELVKSVPAEGSEGSPRYQIDFPVALTGQRMFNCRLICGAPVAPYSMLGGTLLFEAAHPDKPTNRLSVRVLAAQSSKPAQTLASSR